MSTSNLSNVIADAVKNAVEAHEAAQAATQTPVAPQAAAPSATLRSIKECILNALRNQGITETKSVEVMFTSGETLFIGSDNNENLNRQVDPASIARVTPKQVVEAGR